MSGSICSMQTNGTSYKHFTERAVCEIEAGGGMIWAVYGPNGDGDIPKLHYSNWNTPFNFTEFKVGGDSTPYSLSVNSKGDCYAVIAAKPWFFTHDGSNNGSPAEGVDDKTLQISFKGRNFILTTDANSDGNLIMQMGAPGANSYDYGSINLRAIKILSTFHQ